MIIDEAIEQFNAAICSAGLTPPDTIEPDGALHRFASNGNPSDDAGWYVFHADGIPAGAFGCWRGDVSETWRADIGRRLSPQEEGQYRARIEAMRREREAEGARRKSDACEKAAALWQTASIAPENHPYLVKKGIKDYGLREYGDALVVPMRDGAELRSLQFIGPDGGKHFLSGGRVSGCYFLIGKLNGTLCIAEGYATGATIHEDAVCAVAVAFNSGNLLPVARSLRAKFPNLRLIICADDDIGTKDNPGLTKAREAAQAVGALLAVPNFGANRPNGATDFNDLHQHAGFEAVRACIEKAKPVDSSATKNTVEWSDPKPLPDSLLLVDDFDLEFLPDALSPWVADIADRMQCAPEFVAIPAVIALGSVIGRKSPFGRNVEQIGMRSRTYGAASLEGLAF
jgi:putative DNA primase/helicase